MTGETFGALRDHTILGRTMRATEQQDPEAFVRGVDTAKDAGHAGMLATIFSTRTLGLTGQLAPEQQSDYLSGLLIGHELRGLNEVLAREQSNLAGQDAAVDRQRGAVRAVSRGARTVRLRRREDRRAMPPNAAFSASQRRRGSCASAVRAS